MKDPNEPIDHLPVIRQNESSEDILIYEGDMKFYTGMEPFQGPEARGKAIYKWFPYPRVTYQLELLEHSGTVSSSSFEIDHQGLAGRTPFWRLWEDYNGKIKGFVENYESPGGDGFFDSILLQFPNLILFPWRNEPTTGIPESANTLNFSIDGYSLGVHNTITKSQSESLDRSHSYILNGIVEIKRADKKIGLEEVNNLIDIFFEFLSFLNGLRVKPVIIIGISGQERNCIKYSTQPEAPPFLPLLSWAPGVISDLELNKSWQTFFDLCKDEQEKDFFQLAIHWYLESLSMKSGIDAAISLVQNALEVLSSRILFEKEFILRNSEESISASSKINILLTWAKIPNRIPPSATELIKFAKENKLNTGPEAITGIRNSIVHPKLINRAKYKKMNAALKQDAWAVAIYYVELVLLKIIAYDGKVYSRFSDHPIFRFRNDPVPWIG